MAFLASRLGARYSWVPAFGPGDPTSPLPGWGLDPGGPRSGPSLPPITVGGRNPFEPPSGIQIPGTPFGAGVCPQGTRCVGPSVSIGGGVRACLGTCSPYTQGGNGGAQPPGDPLTEPGDALGPMLPPETCDAPTRAYCAACMSGQGSGSSNGNGSPCGPPGGGCGTRYVQVQTKCGPQRVKQKWDRSKQKWVRARRDNVLNPKAQRRAMSRLKGAHRHAKGIIDALNSFAKPKRRSRATRSTYRGCSSCK